MDRYVESSLKARRLFYLAIVIFCGLVFLVMYIDEILPPFSSDITMALEQADERSFLASVLSTIFYISFSIVVFHYTRRAIQSKQWPPVGMAVPFRLKVKEINNPNIAWLYSLCILLIFVAQVTFTWYVYVKQQTIFGSIKQQVEVSPKNIPQDNLASEK